MLVGRSFSRCMGVPIALVLTLLVGCGPERLEKAEADLAAAITRTASLGDTVTLNLFTVVPFAYDRVFIAGPRTSVDTLARVIGGDWLPEMSRGIESADHFHLFVFDVDGKLYPVTLKRSVAEVDSSLTGRMYGPETALFRVQRRPDAAAPTLLPR